MRSLIKCIPILTFLVLSNCSQSPESLNQEIETLSDDFIISRESGTQVDANSKAEQLIKLYNKFVNLFPDDENSPVYLYQAAMLTAEQFGDYQSSIVYFETLASNYPTHQRAENALFLIGFTYNNYLNDLNKAREAYNRYLQQYPNGELAESVTFELENLGKTADEVLMFND